MSARERILARLRAAPVEQLEAPVLHPVRLDAGAVPEDDPVATFTRHFTAAHGEVLDARQGDWRDALRSVCLGKRVQSLMQPAGEPILEPFSEGPSITAFDRPLEAFKTELFDSVGAGLTVADCAIADTGTLVLLSSPRQPRTLSLVPPLHICLLDVSRLHATLADALASERWKDDMPTNLIFVSGPSKTADIQQTLAYGAHGPKEAVVILVSPGAQG